MLNSGRNLSRCLGLTVRTFAAPTQHRFISSRQATEDPGSGCCDAKLGAACKSEEEKPKPKEHEKKIPKECIENPCCPDPPIKYDEEFKDKLVHKERSEFQRTWVECPPRRVVQKVICGDYEPEEVKCAEKAPELPKPEQCEQSNEKCPKITMPGCKPVMIHKDRCKKFPVPSDCEKIKAPYPCYSECLRPKPKPLHPTECGCLAMRSMCEAYTYMRKRGMKIKVKGKS